MEAIKHVAFLGVGSVGAVYAQSVLKHSTDTKVFAIVSDKEKYKTSPVMINDELLPVEFKTPDESDETVDLLLIAVKNHDLKKALAAAKPYVGSNTLILSLLNGMTSEIHIADEFGWEHVLYATVFGIDSYRKDHNIYCSHRGEIHFGEKKNYNLSPRVNLVRDFFESAQISYQIPQDMEKALWQKLLVNVGMNQVSTVMQFAYGEFRENTRAMQLMRSAQQEVVMLALKCGIDLSERDIEKWEEQLSTLSAKGRSSMLQDYWMNRRTEVDCFGGFVCRLGKDLGIPTPINNYLVDEIQRMENMKSK